MSDLALLEDSLGVEFRDPQLLRTALTHSSFVNENPAISLDSNERLEFLGDAVLGYVIAQELYLRYPSLSEGPLTEARAQLVRSESLTAIARRLHLGNYLSLGKGEEGGGGRSRASNLACAVEAVIGAILLDQGPIAAKEFILGQLEYGLKKAGRDGLRKDFKSRLQELAQSRWKTQPKYTTEEREEADGARIFFAEAVLDGRVVGSGTGHSKQSAQKRAAEDALDQIAVRDPAEQG